MLSRMGRDQLTRVAISTGTGSTDRCWNSSNAFIVVGPSSCVEIASATWALGASATMAPMDAGYPVSSGAGGAGTSAGPAMVFRSTFTTVQAVFPWMEWLIWNATVSSTGDALNRKLDTGLGTKTCTQTWQLTASVTFTT